MAKVGTKKVTAVRRQLNTLPVAGKSMSKMLLKSSTTAGVSSDEGNCVARKGNSRRGNALYVPVVSAAGKPLMPCHPARARELVRKGRALRRFSKGIFYIKLLDRTDGVVDQIACGIDTGIKKEAYTVKSMVHTYLNIQADAITWVKAAMEQRKMLRRNRRYRKTPYRKCRLNRSHTGRFPQSTMACWQWRLRIARWLFKLYPIACFVIEDTKVRSKRWKHTWNRSFSPLQYGKPLFYSTLGELCSIELKLGKDTAALRRAGGLKKTKNKLSNSFDAHCVDSWVLANSWVGGHIVPENKDMLLITPLRFHRRQLHKLQPSKGGIRIRYGSTRSLGLKRGALVKHYKYGVVYVGGTNGGRISTHSLTSGKRTSILALERDCKLLTYNTGHKLIFVSSIASSNSKRKGINHGDSIKDMGNS